VRSATPLATYRLQVNGGFGFDDVGAVAGYLAALGVSHAYLSPILEPAPGSTHGYDVVDHSRLNTEAGGREAFDRMSAALRAAGLSAVADVVPNHMAVPTPVRLNAALWSVLRDGPSSPFARWFDVDWSVENRAVLMPVLANRIGTVLAAGELTVQHDPGDGGVLRYGDHIFPLRPGTEELPIEELVDRQWYRLAWWRVGDEELNYRRFFDVDTLAAVRVEDPFVFDATHALLLDLVERGDLTGLRIDHPDGLADPRGYLRRLAGASGNQWVVVEKILEGDERLPADWACAGTTGYDGLHRIGGLFVDPAAAAPLAALLTELTGDSPDFGVVVEAAKREVVEGTLYAEVARLVDLAVDICRDDLTLRDHTRRQLHLCLVELLVAFERYRAYVVPGEPIEPDAEAHLDAACDLARARLPEWSRETLDLIRDLVLDRAVTARPTPREGERRAEFVVRFQQTCGPVMAKGVEDTAFYRWHRLVALNEVGGDPRVVGVPPEDFHDYATRIQRDWPATMTTLSTHDTKRSEDVRARLYALTELVGEWTEAVREWTEAAAPYRAGDALPDPATVYLVWQTLVGTWDGSGGPGSGAISAERLTRYLEKATREAKRFTSWTRPFPPYDEAVAAFARAVLADEELIASVGAFCTLLDPPARVAVLGQKLVQLTMPGVPDVYQGCELVDHSLVDPDNRRPVDFAARRALLAELDGGAPATTLAAEKLLVTSRALRLRREHPEFFTGPRAGYTPLATTTGNAVAFARSAGEQEGVVSVVTRMPVALDRRGGWGEHTVSLPPGPWREVLGGVPVDGGACPLADLLAHRPVALLVRWPGSGDPPPSTSLYTPLTGP
jgi:(1->4)-alpha-D-glucan 1-alpha-D-glucosylmutase